MSETAGLQSSALVGATPSGNGNAYRKRFLGAYIGLGLVFLAVTLGLAVYLLWHQFDTPWSSWRPASSDPATMENAIGSYVGDRYLYYPSTAPIDTIKPVAFITHDPPIAAIAFANSPLKTANIKVVGTTNTAAYQLCGTVLVQTPGSTTAKDDCPPVAATTQPEILDRLVRREVLENALYTFKYVKGVDSVVTLLPAASPTATPTAVFYRKSDLAAQLAVPLDKTLTLATPPLTNAPDPTERATIDGLTLLNGFDYGFVGLQQTGGMLLLSPLT